jgi:hypothetical protein
VRFAPSLTICAVTFDLADRSSACNPAEIMATRTRRNRFLIMAISLVGKNPFPNAGFNA